MNRHVLPTVALLFALTHCGSEAPAPPAGDAGAGEAAASADATPQTDTDARVPSGADAAAGPDGGCTASMERCDNVCTDTNSDRYNCGGCDIRCNTAQSCEGGRCYVP